MKNTLVRPDDDDYGDDDVLFWQNVWPTKGNNPLSVNPIKWSNKLKQFVGNFQLKPLFEVLTVPNHQHAASKVFYWIVSLLETGDQTIHYIR